MDNYNIWLNIWQYSVVAGILVLSVLILRLLIGIFKKQLAKIKSSIKYILNGLTFLFVAIVNFSFLIVVRPQKGVSKEDSINIHKNWIIKECWEWFLWALVVTLILTMFNFLYQRKVERINGNKQIYTLSIIDLIIMCYGIFLSGKISYYGLMFEINYFTY
jgi:hypothetical protein